MLRILDFPILERTQKSISVSPENTQSGRPSQPLLANAETESMIKSLRTKTTTQDAEIADLKAQLAEAAHLGAHLREQLAGTELLRAQVADIAHLKAQLADAQQQLMRKVKKRPLSTTSDDFKSCGSYY